MGVVNSTNYSRVPAFPLTAFGSVSIDCCYADGMQILFKECGGGVVAGVDDNMFFTFQLLQCEMLHTLCDLNFVMVYDRHCM